MRRVSGWLLGGLAVLGTVLLPAPAMAGKTDHFERSFPAAGIGEVQVDLSFHDVRVVVGHGDTIAVTVDLKTRRTGKKADELLADARPELKVDGEVLEIRAKGKHWHGWGSNGLDGKITILMPRGRDLEIETASGDCSIEGDLSSGGLEIETASGDVQLDGVAGDAEVDTASGDIRLSLRRPAGAIELETSSGDVAVTGDMERLEVQTASGDMRLGGSFKKVELETSSGDVDLRWTRVDQDSMADIETASGDVRIFMPNGTVVAGLVVTGSGSIVSDFAGKKDARGKTFELTASSPALRVEISTSSGDVSLKNVKD